MYLAPGSLGLVITDRAYIPLIKGAAISTDSQSARRDSPAKAAAVPRGYLYRTSSILEQLEQEDNLPPIAQMGEKTWHHALCILVAIGTYVVIILFTSGAFGHKLGKYSIKPYVSCCLHIECPIEGMQARMLKCCFLYKVVLTSDCLLW